MTTKADAIIEKQFAELRKTQPATKPAARAKAKAHSAAAACPCGATTLADRPDGTVVRHADTVAKAHAPDTGSPNPIRIP